MDMKDFMQGFTHFLKEKAKENMKCVRKMQAPEWFVVEHLKADEVLKSYTSNDLPAWKDSIAKKWLLAHREFIWRKFQWEAEDKQCCTCDGLEYDEKTREIKLLMEDESKSTSTDSDFISPKQDGPELRSEDFGFDGPDIRKGF